ncbi:hypothetical protein ACIREM_01710 [Streptomyces shenzhenensis]|uniref:hypothetical protein n=1 Tax=Streptomyces shenzhenensis TaxID=943815 RepID=UPI00380F4EC8
MLRLAVLVGALFAFGLLCGQRAHAADGAPSLTSAVTAPSVAAPVNDAVRTLTGVDAPHTPDRPTGSRGGPAPVPAPASAPASDPAPAPASVPAPAADPAPAPAAEPAPVAVPVVHDVVRSVTGGVVGAVGDVVGAVTRTLDEVRTAVPVLPEAPTPPALPELPSLPALPGEAATPLPLPSLSGLSELPGQLLPAPVTSQPVPGEPGEPQASPEPTERTGKRTAAHRTPAGAVHGPLGTVVAPARGSAAPSGGRGAGPAVDSPPHPAPAGDPDGTAGKSALDGGSSRHADMNAVTLHHRAPLGLVPGTAARAATPGARDRHRDIPVFPG